VDWLVVLAKRDKLFQQSKIIAMSLPNATSVHKEMDALRGAIQSSDS
jgi:hypothetical protein